MELRRDVKRIGVVVAALFVFSALPASALTIKNSTGNSVVGSVRLLRTDTPVFQFYLDSNEQVKWSRRLHGHELVLKAVPGAGNGRSSKIVTKPLPSENCRIDIKPGAEGLQLIVED